MKKSAYLIIVGQFALLLILASRPTSAFASSAQQATAQVEALQASMNVQMMRGEQHSPAIFDWHRPWRHGHIHATNQYLHGHCIDSWTTKVFRGHNQNNDGNRGYNSGFAQDNSSNDGNQLINQGLVGGNQVHNQFLRGCISVGNTAINIGSNQSNSGNQGYNRGFIQDNNTNRGNQIVN